MFSVILLACLPAYSVYCQNAYGNIYGYDTSNTGNSNGGLSIVQNPNYQFLNDQLASEYSQNYLSYLNGNRNYDQQSSGGIVTSSSSVPAYGYYTGPALSNDQQNQINYQQIVQRNPSANVNTASTSSNIYGYNYNSGSSAGTTGYNTYNSNVQYSAPSTVQPYVYPFGQYAPAGSSSSNPVLRDQSSNTFSSTAYPSTSVSSSNNIGAGNYYTGRSYTLFDQPQSAQTGYVSTSDLKTTRLRDQPPPATLNLRGTGPLPGPTLNSANANTQLFRDASSNDIFYGNANTNNNNNINTNNGQTTYRFSSRFFDVAGNNTDMYYPYRTSTNWQVGNSGSSTGSSSGVQFDQSSRMSTAAKCALTDPYWCQEYVQIYLSSLQQYEGVSTQQACPSLIASLATSYNGCCTTVRAAGCSIP